MAKKLQDRFLLALLVNGEHEIKRLTGCIVVSRKEGGFYYLGRSGSLRFGATRSGSIPCSKLIYNQLLEQESKIGV